MAADIYIKSFTDKAKWQAVCWLINVVDPKMLSTMIRYNADTKKKLEEEDVAKAAAKKAGVVPATPPVVSGKKKKGKASSSSSPAMAMVEKGPRDLNARRQVIEVCCGPNSYLGQPTRYTKGCEITRITRDIDFTSAAGVKRVCDAILGSRSAVWFSILCIGGCLWQIANFNQGPVAVRRIREYWTLFGTMLKYALRDMAVVHSVGTTIVMG